MSGDEQHERIAVLAPVWYLPPMLADLECRHGNIGACAKCQVADLEAEEQLELELRV